MLKSTPRRNLAAKALRSQARFKPKIEKSKKTYSRKGRIPKSERPFFLANGQSGAVVFPTHVQPAWQARYMAYN